MGKNIPRNKINGDFKGKDILSLDQFSPSDIELLFSNVPDMKDIAVYAKPSDLLKGNIVTLLFYEPSSRTFGSFGAAIKRLGGQTIDILNPQVFSSVSKGETLEDTIRVFESYSDAIVIRHPHLGTAQKAADASALAPILNAGDGIGEHPTQALLDMYTIYEKHKRLDNLQVLFAGDMLNGRTVHSLIRGLSMYQNNTVYLLSPDQLRVSKEEKAEYEKRGLTVIEITSENDMPSDADVWYWTRVQKERFNNLEDYEKVKLAFTVTPTLMKQKAKKDMVLMHPLPRVGEIEVSVDSDPRAVYLPLQVKNGMFIRMALVALVLGKL